VQLAFDKVVAQEGIRPSELWVKTWVEPHYAHTGGRHPRTHFLGYKCVLELESRAQHLGFVTYGSRHFYTQQECENDASAVRGRPALVYQRILNGQESLGFGREYCFVERLAVLPVYDVYEGRSGD
jgi:hypothetical protein